MDLIISGVYILLIISGAVNTNMTSWIQLLILYCLCVWIKVFYDGSIGHVDNAAGDKAAV